MTDSFIQLTTDGSGKKLDTVIVNLGVGSTELHREKLVIADPSSSGGYANVTSSQGLQVLATGPVTITSGLVSVTSGTITSTSATNPWSSAPGFNMPVVTVSSGFATVALQVISTAGYGPVTSSAGQLVSVSSGTITLSSAIGISSGTVGLTSGTVTLSSNPTVVSASSGLVQISGVPVIIVTTSAFSGVGLVSTAMVPTQVSTAGGPTVTSASSGLVQISGTATIVSASSGLVQISGTPTVTMTTSNTNAVALVTSGQLFVGNTTAFVPVMNVTTSGGTLVATTSFGNMIQVTTGKIVPVLQASSGVVSIDLWQGTSQKAPVFITATTISKISSGSGNLVSVSAISFINTTSAGSATVIRFYNASTSNVTVGASVVAALPCVSVATSGTIGPSWGGAVGPIGWGFPTACSFDIANTATGAVVTTGLIVNTIVTALYTT